MIAVSVLLHTLCPLVQKTYSPSLFSFTCFFLSFPLSLLKTDCILFVSGLLSAYLELFHSGQIPDLHIVPISISYERVLEENLYAYEMLGTPKPPESTGVSRVICYRNATGRLILRHTNWRKFCWKGRW